MIASTGETAVAQHLFVFQQQWAFSFRNDRDLGTKSKEQVGGDVSAGGNISCTSNLIRIEWFIPNFG